MTRVVAVLAALLSLVLGAGVAQAATLQQIGGFEEPIYVTSDPGNPNRLFVVERSGRIDLVQEGAVSVFADLRANVSCCGGEQGLLSIALAPDFDTSGRLFVDYIGKEAQPEIHVAELRASGNTAPISSLRQILAIPHPNQSNHYGGQLQFGPEGALFISTGDGGGSDDQEHNAQSIAKPLGKILRLFPDPSGLLPYTVPADNPFVRGAGWEQLVWSYGLRNPFRFSFDRDGSALLIGDVGQSAREEVDRARRRPSAAARTTAGTAARAPSPGPETTKAARNPSAPSPNRSSTSNTTRRRKAGPPAARSSAATSSMTRQLGSLLGRYIYGDNCAPGIRSIDPTAADPYATDRGEGIAVKGLTSFGEDSCGRLYASSSSGGVGVVYRLVGAAPTVCAVPGSGRWWPDRKTRGQGRRRHPHREPDPAASARARGRTGQTRLPDRHRRPLPGRKGEPVGLRVGKQTVARQQLSRACKAHFRPRIPERVRFRAVIAADATYVAATSDKLGLRPAQAAAETGGPKGGSDRG